MRFILKISFIFVYILFLPSSLLLADSIDKDKLEEIIKDTWKIKEDSLLEQWSQYEIDEYNKKEGSSSSSIDRLFWNEEQDEVDVSYFNKYESDSIGFIRIYLNKEAPADDLESRIQANNIEEEFVSIVLNGVRFNFSSNKIEVFLGGLTTDDIETIQDRLRVAVISNEILNPWLRISNHDLKEEFEDNPKDGYYLSTPQQEAIDFLLQIYRDKEHKSKKEVLIQLPTGMGKTRAIFSFIKQIEKDKNPNNMFFANNRNYRVLWFVSGIDVLRQTRKDFNNHFSKSMFGLYGKTNTLKNQQKLNTYNDLVVSLDTLIRKNEQDENYEKSKDNIDIIENWINSEPTPVIIIVDEAHRSNAPRSLEVINQIKNDCSSKIEGLIGMTATPYRSDLDLPEIYGSWYMWEISDNTQRKIKTAYDQLLSAARQGYIPIPYFISLGRSSLLKDSMNVEGKKVEERNVYDELKLKQEFIPVLLRVLKANNKVLIYHGRGMDIEGNSTSKQLSFMKFLDDHKEIVEEMNVDGIYSINSFNKVDKEGNDILSTYRNKKRAILNLTGVGDCGTDIPDVDCIIFLDESESQVKIVQRVGRSSRLSKAKPVTTIIDWGSGRILENLKKKIFFNASPKEIKKDLEKKTKEYKNQKSILETTEHLLSEKEFITEILSKNSLELVNSNPIVGRLIELCRNMEKLLKEEEELGTEKRLLREILETIKNNINEKNLKILKDILEQVNITSRAELVEVLNWYITSNQIEDKDDLVEQTIVEIVIDWMKKNGRYPTWKDYGVEENQVGVDRISMIKRFWGDPNDRRDMSAERFKEKILDRLDIDIEAGILDPKTGREIKLMILNSALFLEYWNANENSRKKLQAICRAEMIYWMRKNNRYPTRDDYNFQDPENSIGFSYDKIKKIFGNEDNPSGIEILKEQILDSDKELEFVRIILQAYIDPTYWLDDDSKRKKLQKCCFDLIDKYIEENKKKLKPGEKINLSKETITEILGSSSIKLYRSYGKKVDKKVNGIFKNHTDLIETFKKHNPKEKYADYVTYRIYPDKVDYKIVKPKLPSKEEVINAIFNFIDELEENEKYWPTRKDLLYKLKALNGVPYSYIIGDVGQRNFVFKNYRELIKEAISLDKEGKYLKYIILAHLGVELYENPDLRKKLQDCFIKDYLIPWIINNKRWPFCDDYGIKDENQLPFNRRKILTTSRRKGMFDNIQELIDRTLIVNREIKQISEKDLCQYIIKFLGEGYLLTNMKFDGFERKQIRKILQEFFIKEYVHPFKIDNEGKYPEIQTRSNVQKYLGYLASFLFGTKDKNGNTIIKGLFDNEEDIKKQYEILYGCIPMFSKDDMN